jgi:hypothetical protein
MVGFIICSTGWFLIRKGDIKFGGEGHPTTIDVDWKRLKISTKVTGLGYFLLGFVLLVLAGVFVSYFGKEATGNPIKITGHLEADDLVDIAIICPFKQVVYPAGKVDFILRPFIDEIAIILNSPGCNPHSKSFMKDEIKNSINFGKIKLERVSNRPEAKKQNIIPLPENLKAPPLQFPLRGPQP